MSLKKSIDDLAAQLQTIRDDISQQLLELPQNPRINPVGQSGAFTIKASDLGTQNWTASYHNFKTQYQALSDLVVQKGSPETIISRLNQALDAQRIKGISLHPDVIEHVRKLL